MWYGLHVVHLRARMRMCLHACVLSCRELRAQYQALVLEQKALTDEEFWSSNAMLKVAGVAGMRMTNCRVCWPSALHAGHQAWSAQPIKAPVIYGSCGLVHHVSMLVEACAGKLAGPSTAADTVPAAAGCSR